MGPHWLLICPQHYTLFYVILSYFLCYIILQAIIKVKVQMLTSENRLLSLLLSLSL